MAKRVIVGDRTSTRVAGTINKARSQVGKDLKTSANASIKAEQELVAASSKLEKLEQQLRQVETAKFDARNRKVVAQDANAVASNTFTRLETAITEFEAQVEAIINGDAQESNA